MKALIQRVLQARVAVNGEVISTIEQGLCVFIGISVHDTVKDLERIARKILSAKLFEDERHKKWKKNVVEKRLEIMCVSQFTLYNTWKGNKPDFHNAMSGVQAREFYEKFLTILKSQYIPDKIKDGQFGAYMQVTITNDGPVTFEIETKPPRAHSDLTLEGAVASGCPVVVPIPTLYRDSTPPDEELIAACDYDNARKEFTGDSDLDRLRKGTTEPAPPTTASAIEARQTASIKAAREAFLRTQAAQEALQQQRQQAELNAEMEACALNSDGIKKIPLKTSSATKEAKADDKDDVEKQASGGSSEAAAKDTKPRNKDAKEAQASGGDSEKLEEETRV